MSLPDERKLDRRFGLIDGLLSMAIRWMALTSGWLLLLVILILTDSFRS